MARICGSTKVVLAALAGNLAVAAVKLVAYALTRSSAVLSEAMHSLVDTADQVLLLVGDRRAARPPDGKHPFGHGMEMYFWSFVVALLIFLVGGVAAMGQGVFKLMHPEPISRPWINLAVLAASAVFEGFSFRAAWREYRRVVDRAHVDIGVLSFVLASKDPSVFTTLVEDSAALAGLALAGLGTIAAMTLGWAWADGAASAAIGALMLGVAALLANETRSLIVGEGAARPIQARILEAAEGALAPGQVLDVSTLHFGPATILVFVCLRLDALTPKAAAALSERIRAADPRVTEVVFRFRPSPEALRPE